MLEERRKQLLEAYQSWERKLKEACPQLINAKYSHPYYLHIPDNWFEAEFRILIVGEEGYGDKQFDLPIVDAQAFNKKYLSKQLSHGADNRSPFWRRIRKISALTKCSIAWTNLDKIHVNGKNCKLKIADRMALHQTPIAILREELRILGPHMVVYFGWYGISLRAELPKVFQRLYPGGLKDHSQWKDEKLRTIEIDGIHHVFTYHPNWGQRTRGYEDKVLDEIRKILNR